MAKKFGWYPYPLNFVVGGVSVSTLDGLDAKIEAVRQSPGAYGGWIYAPRIVEGSCRDDIRALPFQSRVFGLPKTHSLNLVSSDSDDCLSFLVWALSFFIGMRLTTTDAGFLDATPLERGRLCDFVLTELEVERAVQIAEMFWVANNGQPARDRRWVAAVHTLFLAQYPQALQFERFGYLYSALDTCFRLTVDLHAASKPLVKHGERVGWVCARFGMPVPTWAKASSGNSLISDIRNPAIHESLYLEAPLGFALHGVGTGENLTLEMEALVCRFLVALIGSPNADYVRSPVTTRMTHGWSP